MTPHVVLGPFYPLYPPADAGPDLLRREPASDRTGAPLLEITGQVLTTEGRPIANALVEIWQADAGGRYVHPRDRSDPPADPDFRGYGRLRTGEDGRYQFRTVTPGAYHDGIEMRAPHVHFQVTGRSDRLITQLFFENEPMHHDDRWFKSSRRPHLLESPLLQMARGSGSPTLLVVWNIVLGRLSRLFPRRVHWSIAMVSRRRLVAASAVPLLVGSLGLMSRALAQSATRPCRVVVGFPPGGAPDVVARLVADTLRGPYAATVIVENKAGAGGRIAAETVKKADADGSTLLITPNPIITIYPHVYRKLAYDPLHDFVPITSLCRYPLVLSAGPGLPEAVKSLSDVVAWARAHPDSASFATPAAGSTLHFVGVVFAAAAGFRLEHVPYRGGAEVVTDLVGGRVPLAVTPPTPIVPHIRAGRVRALAITSAGRSLLLPDVPTFAESGYPQLAVEDWIGLFAPSKTPGETVERLNARMHAALMSREVKEAYATLMMEPSSESAQDAMYRVQSEYEMWRPIVKASGFVAVD